MPWEFHSVERSRIVMAGRWAFCNPFAEPPRRAACWSRPVQMAGEEQPRSAVPASASAQMSKRARSLTRSRDRRSQEAVHELRQKPFHDRRTIEAVCRGIIVCRTKPHGLRAKRTQAADRPGLDGGL